MLNPHSTEHRWFLFTRQGVGRQRREASARITTTLLLFAISLASCNGLSPSLSTTGSPTASPASETPSVTGLPASPIKNYVVSGTIIAGGDTTPPDLVDAPRVFSYSLQTGDGQIITLTYTAFPPSPNQAVKKIKLVFHSGVILIGDYVQARGSYDAPKKTLVVAEEGDFIETFATKP